MGLLSALQKKWGVTAARANAQLLLDRLSYVGRGAATAATRRDSARAAHAARRRRICQWALQRPRRFLSRRELLGGADDDN